MAGRRRRGRTSEHDASDRARDLLFEEYPAVREQYELLKPHFDAVSRLIALRTEAGLTQAELAERMGRRQSVISAIESGRREPRVSTLAAAARALGYELQVDFVPAEPGEDEGAPAR